jgi:hypothetical protein
MCDAAIEFVELVECGGDYIVLFVAVISRSEPRCDGQIPNGGSQSNNVKPTIAVSRWSRGIIAVSLACLTVP